jgi:hypothetical protein
VQKYPVRATHRRNLTPAALEPIMKVHFSVSARDGDAVRSEFGAISEIRARGEGKELMIEVTMNPKVPEDVARDTIRRYNEFLEEVTGFSSKERAKRLKKSATSPAAGD